MTPINQTTTQSTRFTTTLHRTPSTSQTP